jgi:NAD(P)-dependent dehydrogenase (short-subunit alcohol dehydrogenase family)
LRWRAFGGIDILVNNAARAIGGKVDEIDEATWNDRHRSTNLTSVWRGMRVCVPVMRKRGGGAIVNISSVQSLAASGLGGLCRGQGRVSMR